MSATLNKIVQDCDYWTKYYTLITHLNCGVNINGRNVSCLAYADDIVILSHSEANLQLMLDCFTKWCRKWQLLVNVHKSNIVHFRSRRIQRSNFVFSVDDKELLYVDNINISELY